MKKALILLMLIVIVLIAIILNYNNILKIIYKTSYSNYVEKYAEEYNVDPLLIYSIIKAESNFDAGAVSNKGACGLMQIMDNTAKEVAQNNVMEYESGVTLYNAEKNIKIGVVYFAGLIKEFGNERVALAAYNAGSGNVTTWIKNGIIKSDGSDASEMSSKSDEVEVNKATDEKEVTWKICVLIPESDYNAFIRRSRLRWLTIAAVFMIAMIIACLIISKSYVEPIVTGMEALKGEGEGEPEKTGYSEIDELLEFIRSKGDDEPIIEEKLPENVAALFDNFVENSKKLSPAEWTVMRLYIEGHEIAEVPDLAFISIATVRKHNRSIYEKLEVASRDELMLYIDLFRRCNRLDELVEGDTGFTDN